MDNCGRKPLLLVSPNLQDALSIPLNLCATRILFITNFTCISGLCDRHVRGMLHCRNVILSEGDFIAFFNFLSSKSLPWTLVVFLSFVHPSGLSELSLLNRIMAY